MQDKYLDNKQQLDRLRREYLTHGILYVAFDFDNTVFDFHEVGDTFPKVIKLLQECQQFNFKLILFTTRKDDRLKFALKYCTDELKLIPNFVNENPEISEGHTKPYYNILLDDRAGLGQAYNVLNNLITEIENGTTKFNR